MQHDAQGNALSTQGAEAARAFDHAIEGYLKYRFDTALRLKAALAADPDCGLLHSLKAAFLLLSYKQSFIPLAQEAAAKAAALSAHATERERAHAAAVTAWAEGDLPRAIGTWAQILAAHPRDILAFRLHHYTCFWTGQPEAMLGMVEALLPRWGREVPGWGSLLACRAFANEECGNYVVAEASGRAAVALDPGDLWAAHAVAHVLEMQGRRGEGIAWIAGLERHWDGANNLAHHLWWHRALYHLERREYAAVLELHDTRYRDLESPVTQQQPDFVTDVQNAASMLFRLERQGVDVGDRWTELADKAEARIGDCLSAFTLPHWMLALAATGRFAAAERMLEGMREHARSNTAYNAALVGQVALPVCEAVLLRARGDAAGAVARLRPVVSEMWRMGGSHAQQDVLEQLFLDAAMQAGSAEDARLLLERVAGRHPVAPERRVGYAAAAREVLH